MGLVVEAPLHSIAANKTAAVKGKNSAQVWTSFCNPQELHLRVPGISFSA